MIDLGWVVQLATVISLMATAVAAIMALREFRLKQKSAQAELDLKMM